MIIRIKMKVLPAILIVAMLFVLLGIFLAGSINKKNGGNGSENSSKPHEIKDIYPTPTLRIENFETSDINVYSKAFNRYFYLKDEDGYKCVYLKGVNMGLTLPTTDLGGGADIPYNTYIKWFSDIKNMGANTVKVFTVMNPDFYNALYDYNINNPNAPLYLIQGIWINENDMTHIGDAFGQNGKILSNFKRSVRETVDIINGNSDYTSYGKIDPAIYDKDLSPYTVGYVLGLEWQPDFIINTNANNEDKPQFEGDYLYTENASPFEIFLCEVGDYLIKYETNTYNVQTPVAFLNWATTDFLEHTNEPFAEEDAVSLNTENIKPTESYYAGLFAALDVYPYYPEFLNHQKEYLDFKDESGKSNPFRAYLRDLYNAHTVPVLVAEYGVPTSRATAHESVMGYNQGGITEKQQGEILLNMTKDIAKEGFAGGIIFSWQDEWFKQTWNTYKYSTSTPVKRSLNVQSAEQRYGILAFDPGLLISTCYPDGSISEWQGIRQSFKSDDVDLYIKYDEAHLYIMGKVKAEFDFNGDTLLIPVSITGKGNMSSKEYNVTFEKPADFLLILNGKDKTRLLTDAYYDYFNYEYCVKRKIFPESEYGKTQNSGVFNPVRMFLSNEMYLPVDKITIPAKHYETGLLTFGNANPRDKDYNSLSDFYFKNDIFEIRIPWALLNVADPANRLRISGFNSKTIGFAEFDKIGIGASVLKDGVQIKMSEYSFTGWEKSFFHERLKDSYYILMQNLGSVMKEYN